MHRSIFIIVHSYCHTYLFNVIMAITCWFKQYFILTNSMQNISRKWFCQYLQIHFIEIMTNIFSYNLKYFDIHFTCACSMYNNFAQICLMSFCVEVCKKCELCWGNTRWSCGIMSWWCAAYLAYCTKKDFLFLLRMAGWASVMVNKIMLFPMGI